MVKQTVRIVSLGVIGSFLFAFNCAAKDGVYMSSVVGRNGEIQVEVTIKNDRIDNARIVNWAETHPVADKVRDQLLPDIVKFQNVDCDIVSGATFSSFAVKQAVSDCIAQAGLDIENFEKGVPEKEKITAPAVVNTDVIVVGAGGAGLSAAIAAAQAGKNVIVLEKNHFIGGNTSVCGGCLNVANMHQQNLKMNDTLKKTVETILSEKPRNALHGELLKKCRNQWEAWKQLKTDKLFDSPEFHALQTYKSGDYAADLALVYQLTQSAAEAMTNMEKMGLVWRDNAIQFVGALWPRSNRAKDYGSGVGYIDTMLKFIKEQQLPITFELSTKVGNLISKDGKVCGVQATRSDKSTLTVNANDGVVLATGGFGANVAMRNQYDELWGKKLGKQIPTTNLPSATGDGIKLAQKVGADLMQMGWIQIFPATDPSTGGTSYRIGENTNIYVNADGKRFVNESERRDVLAKAALAQKDGRFFVISSAKRSVIKDGRNAYGLKISDLIKSGRSFEANTIEELAKKAGINSQNLKETVEKWNQVCQKGAPDEMGRSVCMEENRLDEGGPYYATLMTPGVHHTMGGLRINTKAQVLHKDGTPIQGLYAAGEVTGGIHGTNRVGCNAVLDALVYGRIAGRSVTQNH